MEQITKKLFLKLLLFSVLFFAGGHEALAGVIRKPPNNLGLVLYWPMNEGAGTSNAKITDHSGNGHTATFPIAFYPGWVNGKFGKALAFTTSPTQTNPVTFSAISVGTTHTVSMWIYITANCASWGNLFASDGGNGLYCLSLPGGNGTGNKIDYYYSGDHLSSTPIPLNQWHHIAVSNNTGTVTFYLDGVADGTASGLIGFTASRMGNDSGSDSFSGYIDDLRVYNRAFSDAEVLALYKSGSTKIGLSNSSPGTLAQGLTGYWTFDGKDMVSNVADLSGNGNTGYLTNFTSTTTVPGKIGQALNFDGVDDYVNVGSNTSIRPGTGDFSVSLWYKGLVGNGEQFIGNTSGGIIWNIGELGGPPGSGTAYFETNLFPFHQIRGNFTLPNDNDWHHLVVTLNRGPSPDTISAYLDGQSLAITYVAQTLDGENVSPTKVVEIGVNIAAGDVTRTGPLDEVRIYQRALSAAEVNQLYRLGAQKVGKTSTPTGTLQTGLVGHWTFDGGDTNWATNTVTDKSGNGITGTLTNMSTTSSPVLGKIGQALNFVAANSQSVNLGSSSTIQPATGSFSISLWYKGLRGATESFISSGPSCCSFWDIENGGTTFTTGGPGVTKNYTLPNDNEWHHLVVVLDRAPNPDTVEAYIDGVSQGAATGTLDNENVTGGGGVNIGRGTWLSGGYRQGPMDDVRIYNRALSASEVKQLYNLGK